MKKLFVAAFALFALPACQDALAQVIRPQATPRSAVASARPVATMGRIPETPVSSLPSGAVLDMSASSFFVFSADDGTGAITEGTEVGSWRDQSDNAYLFVQNGSPHAVWNDAQINGLPALTFGGGSSIYIRSGVTDAVTGPLGMTMAAVIKHTNNGAVLTQDEGSGSVDKWIFAAGGFGIRGLHINTLNGSGGSTTMTGGFVNDSTWHLVIFRRKTDGTWEFRRDGAQTETGTDATAFGTPNTGDIEIGVAEGSITFTGQMARIVLYGGALSDGDYAALETELQSIYGL